MKKRKLLGLLLASLGATLAVGAASCGKTGKDSSAKPNEDYGEAGVYYAEVGREEYMLWLDSEKDVFTLVTGENQTYGAYEYDGVTLKLTYGTEQEATANIEEGILKLTYEGREYDFRRKDTYKVSYEVGTGASAVADDYVVNGKTLKKPQDPTKAGYDFIGWYEDAGYQKVFYFDGTPVTKNLTLYARFEKETALEEYEIAFDLGYEGAEASPQQTIGGKLYELPDPSRAGYEFAGWWRSDYADGTKLTCKYEKGERLNGAQTLYAVWKDTKALISVRETGIEWEAKGTNNSYTLELTLPSGEKKVQTSGQTSYSYNFAESEAGDYTVKVTVNGEESYAYYRNKALAQVGGFSVADPSVLVYGKVEKAEKYIITVECGDAGHTHEQFDNGASTYFNFGNCKAKDGKIKFTVEAQAKGYMSSRAEYTYDRILDSVTGLVFDETTEELSWKRVEKATSYRVEVEVGGETYTWNVGNERKFTLREYTGELTVKVYAETEGYASGAAAEYTYHKTRLASAKNVRVTGNKVVWEAVPGAVSYNVRVNGKTYPVATGTELELTETMTEAGVSEYRFAVVAVSDEAEKDSLESAEVTATFGALDETLEYGGGKVSWKPVIGATGYAVRVNGEVVTEAAAGETEAEVTLTKHGENTIEVSYYTAEGKQSKWSQTRVEAYGIYFDERGGEKVEPLYKAVGDPVELPKPTLENYTFGGWYNMPGGSENNASKYESKTFQSNGDVYLYAYWGYRDYTVRMEVNEKEGSVSQPTATVYYRNNYKLPVAESKDGSKLFKGWYTEPNGQGFRYTNIHGESINKWTDNRDLTLYAAWATVFKFTPIKGGEEYAVSKGEEVGYFDSLTIPATYNGKPVTSVDSFESCSTLKSIYIPDTVLNIETGILGPNGAGAVFKGCGNLTNIHIYEVEGRHERRYESIDGVLFSIRMDDDGNVLSGKKLIYFPYARKGEYSVPEGTVEIGDSVFRSVNNISKIVIPYTVTRIGSAAFRNSKISEVVFAEAPEGEKADALVFGEEAFGSCSSLFSVTLPARLSEFNANIFVSCSKLENINIKSGGVYSSVDGVVCTGTGANKTIIYCPRGRIGEYIVPEEVTTIGEKAFSDCYELTKVVFHEDVTSIGKEAFKMTSSASTKLESAEFNGTAESDPLYIEESAFYNCAKLNSVSFPVNLVKIGAYAFGGTSALASVSIVTDEDYLADCGVEIRFEANAFSLNTIYKTSCLKNLYLGAKVPHIAIGDIFGAALVSVTIDDNNPNFKSIDGVVYNTDITSIDYFPAGKTGEYTLPETVTLIGGRVFKNKNLEKITIRANVTEIGAEAFSECRKLAEVIFEKGGSEDLIIRESAFYNCKALESIELPERLVELGDKVFENCECLVSASIPKSLQIIGETEGSEYAGVECKTEKISRTHIFDGCKVLERIDVDSENENFASVDGVLYAKQEGKAVTLLLCPVKNSGNNGVIDIPKSVTSILPKAFCNNVSVKEVKFSEGTEGALTIGGQAFYKCVGLEKVTIPEKMEQLSVWLFQGCTSLREIVIPSTMTTIGYAAFQGCTNLSDVKFTEGGSNTLTFINGESDRDTGEPSGGVFSDCKSLTTLVLPNKEIKGGKYAFGNSGLETVTLSPAMTRIPDHFFSYAKQLTTVNFAEGNRLETIESGAFSYSGLPGVVRIPEGVKTLGYGAFQNCPNLTGAYIPSTVEEMYGPQNSSASSTKGGYTFYSCGNFESVEFGRDADGNTALKTIGWSAFSSTKLKQIEIPASVVTIEGSVFLNCKSLSSVTFEAAEGGTELTAIGNTAFSDTGLTSFRFPSTKNNLTLGERLFSLCYSLKEVYISEKIASVTAALKECPKIQTVTISPDNQNLSAVSGMPIVYNADGTAIRVIYNAIPEGSLKDGVFTVADGITTIDNNAFEGQAGIRKIVIPKSVKAIGQYAFKNCINLEEVEFVGGGNEALTFSTNAFLNCISLQTFTVPTSVTSLPNNLFDGCTGLEKVIFHNGVTVIGQYSFRNCYALKTIAYSDRADADGTVDISTVTTLSNNAFWRCGSIKKVMFNQSLKSIGNYAFAFCSSLNNVALPDSLTSIGSYAFRSCVSLQSIVIPSGIKTVGNYMFLECTGLKEVTFTASTYTLNGNVFQSCTSLERINISGATKVGDYLFQGCTALCSVELNEGLTALGKNMFEDCVSLKKIDLPSSLTFMGTYTFRNSGLTEITIPSGVKKFRSTATASASTSNKINLFEGCVDLAKVTFPEDFEEIGGYTFKDCTSLRSVDLPDSIKLIGHYAFQNTGLTEVVLPSGLTGKYLGTGVFTNCASLKSADLSKVSTSVSFGSSYANKLFDGCTALEEVTFNKDGISGISSDMFVNCISLKNIDLPKNTGAISSQAFMNTGIVSFAVPSTVTNIARGVFKDCAKLVAVDLPGSLTKISEGAFAGTALQSVLIPANVSSIEKNAFGNCKALTEIEVSAANANYKVGADGALYDAADQLICYPAGLSGVSGKVVLAEGVTLLDYAFNGCDKIESVALPGSVTVIPKYAFYGCAAKSVVLTDGVTMIDDYAFENSGLESIVIPGSVATIGNYAFGYCEKLTAVTIQNGVNTIKTYAFAGSGLESIVMPESVTSIGNYAFKDSNLQSFEMTKGAPTFGTYLFNGCRALENVVLPDALKEIGTYTFADCVSLKAVKLPNELTKIANYAFANSGIESIEIPKGVTSIGTAIGAGYVFDGCVNLQSVTFKGAVTIIGGYAFRNCESLESIVIPDSVATIGTNAFMNCTALKSIVIPKSVGKVGGGAFAGWTAEQTVNIENSMYFITKNWIIGDGATSSTALLAYWYDGCNAEIVIDYTASKNGN